MGIGRRLKEAREAVGLTQEQLGKRIGVTGSAITNYEKENSHPKEAVLYALIEELGIEPNFLFQDCVKSLQKKENAPLTRDAIKLAKDFDGLDGHGKRVLRLVADEEKERCESERNNVIALSAPHSDVKAATETTYYVVPYYRDFPASAGFGEWAADVEPPEELLLRKRPPRGTTFICPVSGVSMTPTFRDGEKVFVRKQSEIRVGQIGIFLMDEKMWIKEMGEGELISHNPEYEPRRMIDGIECQGLVLGVCDDSYF